MASGRTSSRSTRGPAARASSDERREQVIEAAVKEFAAHGFHAASTSAIAKRAGISQPYIYALFPNKRELFLATSAHITGRIRDAFSEAAGGVEGPEAKLEAMGDAYTDLLERRDEILVQMQAHAAAGDPALAGPVRKEFMGVVDHVGRVAGVARERAIAFVAVGMYLNVVAALDLPEEYSHH